MLSRSFYNSISQSLILTFVLISSFTITAAQVRTSPSYQLQSDSVNFGGGLGTSTNYSLESTGGEVATGPSDSSSYSLRAGYQQMQEVFLSLTGGASVTMNPSIGGLTGGTSNGSTTVSVLTDSPSGYELYISAESAPAMQKAPDSISDYVASSSPQADYNFNIPPSDAAFGFSPEGSDIITRFKNNGSACGVGALVSSLTCWDGLSVSDTLIASGSANQPSGVTTTLNFRVGVGSGAGVVAGTYVATTTITAIAI